MNDLILLALIVATVVGVRLYFGLRGRRLLANPQMLHDAVGLTAEDARSAGSGNLISVRWGTGIVPAERIGVLDVSDGGTTLWTRSKGVITLTPYYQPGWRVNHKTAFQEVWYVHAPDPGRSSFWVPNDQAAKLPKPWLDLARRA